MNGVSISYVHAKYTAVSYPHRLTLPVVRLANGENWTNASLGYVADMWPMPVEAFVNEENPYKIQPREGASPPARFWYPVSRTISL